MKDSEWRIDLQGHAWAADEARKRWKLTPERLEMFEGKLLFDDENRVRLLALLLENVGAARAVRLGSLEVWREAVRLGEAELRDASNSPSSLTDFLANSPLADAVREGALGAEGAGVFDRTRNPDSTG